MTEEIVNNPLTVDSAVVEKWLTGWSLSRTLPLPVKYKDGFFIEVGRKDQKTRYVFPQLSSACIDLFKTIKEPYQFIKICTHYKNVESVLLSDWIIQQLRYMMIRFDPFIQKQPVLPNTYSLNKRTGENSCLINVVSRAGDIAATGRIVFIDDYAIYDRIETDPEHRRKGLASFILNTLDNIVLSKKIKRSVLVATSEGKGLYEKKGWTFYSYYSSFVRTN